MHHKGISSSVVDDLICVFSHAQAGEQASCTASVCSLTVFQKTI
jgi:hypothetical protein